MKLPHRAGALPAHCRGFSLLEMSVVIAIVSIIAVMGLEATSIYLGRTAYTSTRDKIAAIDQALRNYYRITGRLPCPANRTQAESYSAGTTYGFEDCAPTSSIFTGGVVAVGVKAGGTGYSGSGVTFNNTGTGGSGASATYTQSGGIITAGTVTVAGSGYYREPTLTANTGGSGAQLVAGTNALYFGSIPTAELGLPVSAGLDAYGVRINYVVTQGLTNAYSFNGTNGNIEVRSGLLKQPCSGTCDVLADPTASPSNGAAYFVFSSGANQRGGVNRNGTGVVSSSNPVLNCLSTPTTTSFDLAIDSQNCAAISGSGLDTASIGGTIPFNVFYDSRFNTGSGVEANIFDDIVVWRTKGQL
ncbi:MAG: type II secretion system protein [Rickettsiales bacterium]